MDITQYEPIAGCYTLGYIQQHRPDIHLIHEVAWKSYEDYAWLDTEIRQALAENKIVACVPWDEDIVANSPEPLAKVLNQFVNDPVYWVTQFDTEMQKLYTFQYGIKCKMLELPWYLLNECLSYLYVEEHDIAQTIGSVNYICLLGRYEPHKFAVAEELNRQGLSKYGYISVAYPEQYPENDFCHTNPFPPYNADTLGAIPHGIIQHNNILISKNVQNFLRLKIQYANVPLVVNVETTCGIIHSTEKSIWPLLLGKLFLLFGRPGAVKFIQRFYDVDIAGYANVEYDLSTGWTPQDHQNRIERMVRDNRELITNAQEQFIQLQPSLEQAKFTFTQRMNNYFISQLALIK